MQYNYGYCVVNNPGYFWVLRTPSVGTHGQRKSHLNGRLGVRCVEAPVY